MRCTVDTDRPLACAMPRELQCVAFLSTLSRMAVTSASIRSSTVRGAPGAVQAAHGRFDAQAKSKRDIYSSRQADMVAAGLLLFGGLGLAMLAASPFTLGPALAVRAVLRRVA